MPSEELIKQGIGAATQLGSAAIAMHQQNVSEHGRKQKVLKAKQLCGKAPRIKHGKAYQQYQDCLKQTHIQENISKQEASKQAIAESKAREQEAKTEQSKVESNTYTIFGKQYKKGLVIGVGLGVGLILLTGIVLIVKHKK